MVVCIHRFIVPILAEDHNFLPLFMGMLFSTSEAWRHVTALSLPRNRSTVPLWVISNVSLFLHVFHRRKRKHQGSRQPSCT